MTLMMNRPTQKIKISELIAPTFREIWLSIKKHEFSEYDETGGRGSTKSSFISLVIVLCMMFDRQLGDITHAVVLRQLQKDLRESVFEQIGWAIDKLHVRHLWKRSLNPMKWVYLPYSKYPQEIRFRGCDDPSKVKSIKFAYGRCAYVWFEEKDQFKSATDIQNIKLSLARKNDADDGVDDWFVVFSSYNPPEIPNHWINIDAKKKKPYRHQHHTTYLDVPREWLTDAFIEEAEQTKATNIDEYNHVFLGKVTGVKGLCYPMFDINKHVIDLRDAVNARGQLYGKLLKPYERIVKCVCGCDGGTIIDATTLSPMLLTTAGRIILLPVFYYSPVAGGHTPLACTIQCQLMSLWLDYWFYWLLGEETASAMPRITTIVVDSAAQDLVLEFNRASKYTSIKVPSKDKILDMKRHQNVLSAPDYFIHVNAGHIDPLSIRMNIPPFQLRVVDDNDYYIQEVVALCVDENTGKPLDGNDHVIDGFNYGINVATKFV